MLASDTHKFESKYLDKLVGGTVAEVPEIYKERSPVHHADKITAPLLVSSVTKRVYSDLYSLVLIPILSPHVDPSGLYRCGRATVPGGGDR